MRLLLLMLTIMLLCAAARGQGGGRPDPEPGISRDLARRRAEHYRDLRYQLDIDLRPGDETLRGTVMISVALDNPSEDLVLDWRAVKRDADPRERLSQLSVNGEAVADARFVNDHIVIPASHLRRGENVLRMNFESPISTSGSAVTRYLDREDNSEYVYTLFVPSDASTAFPCFDQPDLKARFKLRASAPTEWKVVGNVEAETVTRSGAWSLWSFGETQPISTYQFAFAAGPFAVFGGPAGVKADELTANPPAESTAGLNNKAREADGPRMNVYVRKSKSARALRELPEVFRINREGVKFFEQYFGHKFPFSKYDLVVIPEFAYNGMEHAGATFLREEGILFPSDPTATDLAVRAELMLHEAAHQWFGDLVTMRWFDDLWLKEGFATFMAYKAVENVMPDVDAWKVFHLRTKPLAYLTDVTKGTTPIWQEIPNLSAAKSAYGNIVYRKAPSILRQAEFYLGPEVFRQAVRLLVKEHAYSNAEWADLVRSFERASGRKLNAWADAWVRRRGMPEVHAVWDASRRVVRLEQRDALGEGGVWPMRIEVVMVSFDGRTKTDAVRLDGQTAEVGAGGSYDFVFANSNDFGYGLFLLDERSRAKVLERPESWMGDDFTSTLILGSLWEGVRRAELAPLDYVELVIKVAPTLREDVTLQPLLARAQTAYTRYLSDEQRRTVGPRLERLLSTRMMTAETAGLRITYFRALRDVASSPEALDRLKQILFGTLRVPGMSLRPRDRFDIVRTLVANGDPQAAALLRKVGDDDKSDDGRRYLYATAAAAPDPAAKRKYFQDFTRNAELPESWIEAAFGPFNSPRQSELTLPHLAPSLDELPNLKRTRKIFFVNGWLAAFVGGQCSEQSLGVVNDFLRSQQNLDRDLRLKVLEAADGLERCVRIRAKYAGNVTGPNRTAP